MARKRSRGFRDPDAPPSNEQQKYLAGLLEGKVGVRSDHHTRVAQGLTVKTASDLIQELKELPWKPRPAPQDDRPSPTDLPAGRYAYELDGKRYFFHVWRGQRNPNAVRLYGLHGTPDPLNTSDGTVLLKMLAKDAARHAIDYGHWTNRCSRCGLVLKNRLSVELGIGPVCGMHWFSDADWADKKDVARATIMARGEDPDETVTPPDLMALEEVA